MRVCRRGDEISFTNMGLVAEMVLAQVCVRLVSSFVGRLARGPTDQRDLVPSPAHLHLDQTGNFSSDTVFQPDDGRVRPKHVVGELLYL